MQRRIAIGGPNQGYLWAESEQNAQLPAPALNPLAITGRPQSLKKFEESSRTTATFARIPTRFAPAKAARLLPVSVSGDDCHFHPELQQEGHR